VETENDLQDSSTTCLFFLRFVCFPSTPIAQLLNQKVGTTRSSAAIHYANKTDRKLWEHLQNFIVPTLEEGVARLK
jgi:hypothetical protein